MRQRFLPVVLTLISLVGVAGAERPIPQPGETASQHVDQLLAQEIFLKQANADLAPPVDDEAFLRRVSLDLVGELPTPAEVTLFLFDPAKDKAPSWSSDCLPTPGSAKTGGAIGAM